jgi:hypothetical protein
VWDEWFLRTPHGPCLVLVATVDEEIVGQIVFTPTVLHVGNSEVRALRMSAPIVRTDRRDSSIRGLSLFHPAVKLWSDGLIAAASLGYQVVYALPENAWVPLLEATGRNRIAKFECWEAPIEGRAIPNGWTPTVDEPFGPEHERLWSAMRAHFAIGCAVKRTKEWWTYRLGSHLTVHVRRPDGTLAGFVALHRKTGLIQELVADSREAIESTLRTALASLGTNDRPITMPGGVAKAMAISKFAPILAELGFRPSRFWFPLSVDVLDLRLDAFEFDPERWHTVPAD